MSFNHGLYSSSIFSSHSKTTKNARMGTDDYDISSAMLEALISLDDSAFVITKEHMQATYLYGKDGNTEILEEGLKDLGKSVGRFFAMLIKKFKQFINRAIMLIRAYFGNFDKFINKYRSDLADRDPNFSVQGFIYSLHDNIPDLSHVKGVVSNFNTELSDVRKLKKEDVLTKIRSINGGEELDKIRGSIIAKGSPIDQGSYLDEIKKVYRDGSEETDSINVDKSNAKSFLDEYEKLKGQLKTVSKQRDDIIRLVESMKEFFDRGAAVHYEGSEKKVIKAHNVVINKAGNGLQNVDDEKIKYSPGTLETVNMFYNLKWKEARTIGAATVLAMTEKVNAIKEAIKLNTKIIRKIALSGKEKEGDK